MTDQKTVFDSLSLTLAPRLFIAGPFDLDAGEILEAAPAAAELAIEVVYELTRAASG